MKFSMQALAEALKETEPEITHPKRVHIILYSPGTNPVEAIMDYWAWRREPPGETDGYVLFALKPATCDTHNTTDAPARARKRVKVRRSSRGAVQDMPAERTGLKTTKFCKKRTR